MHGDLEQFPTSKQGNKRVMRLVKKITNEIINTAEKYYNNQNYVEAVRKNTKIF